MYAVELENITKTFDGVKANDSINLKVIAGEIHAIVGENGAGKSTLMKVLYGMYKPDSGRILINGKETSIDSPFEAITICIGMVHQHFMLVGPLTVIENIILGKETTVPFGLLNIEDSKKRVKKLLSGFNINIDLDSTIDSLPVGIQQKVEILKILYRKAEILILDEPTAVLTPQETDGLFETLRVLKREGKTIIIITHKLAEVLEISDHVTILRSGKLMGVLETNKTNKEELAMLMVGHEINPEFNAGGITVGEKILEVSSLLVKNDHKLDAVKNISFEISAGEIFGIAGVEGNGQTELVEAITGLRNAEQGNINITGNKTIAHIPSDRHKEGVVMDFDIAENMILGRQREKQFGSVLKLNYNNVNKYSKALIEEYDVRPKDYSLKISGLSGGNQQKAVVARELSKNAGLIVVSHPTRGLDIKASEFVHHSILKEKEKGKAVLLVSSELSELLKLSDRIAVMYNGEISVILDAKKTDEREIGLYMTGGKK